MTHAQEARVAQLMANERKVLEEHPEEMTWLLNYRGNFHVFLSYLQQVRTKGFLSPGQCAAVQRAIQRDKDRAAQESPQAPIFKGAPRPVVRPQFTFRPGEQIEIKSSIARGILEKRPDLKVVFRNLEIVKIQRETQKAILVDVRFISKIVCSCHICGQPLDTEISKACGIGPTCAKKLGFQRPKLSDAASILRAVEDFCRGVGIIKDIWLPKSCIRRVNDIPDLIESVAAGTENMTPGELDDLEATAERSEGREIHEASDLGLAPGVFPQYIEIGGIKLLRDREPKLDRNQDDVVSYIYRGIGGRVVEVLND